MFERASVTSPAAGSQQFNLSVRLLEDEIQAHQKQNDSRSYLARGVNAVASMFYSGDSDSFEHLKQLDVEAKTAAASHDESKMSQLASQIDTDTKKDQAAVGTSNEIARYGGELFKIGSLFYGGTAGWVGAGLFYAADQANPNDAIGTQVIDGSLGALKGIALKGAIGQIGSQSWGFATKGATMGVVNRVIDEGLTRQTYLDPNGNFNLSSGATKVVSDSLNPQALGMDVAVFGAGFGLGAMVSKFVPAIAASPFLSTVATGGSFGIASGAMGEASREMANNESLSFGKIATRALLDGAVFSIAAVPGGMQAQRAFDNDSEAARQKAAEEQAKQEKAAAEAKLKDAAEAKVKDFKLKVTDPSDTRILSDHQIGSDQTVPSTPAVKYLTDTRFQAQRLTQPVDMSDQSGATIHAQPGDWTITDAQGRTYAVPADEFASNFAPSGDGNYIGGLPAATVKAEMITQPTQLRNLNGRKFMASAGDYKITDADGHIFGINRYDFIMNYRFTGDGEYGLAATARQITSDITVKTAQGDVAAKAGQYLVTDPQGRQSVMSSKELSQQYQWQQYGSLDNSLPPAVMGKLPETIQRTLAVDPSGRSSTGTTPESEGIHWTTQSDGTRITSWEESGTRRIISPDQTMIDVMDNGLMLSEQPKSLDGYGTIPKANLDPALPANAKIHQTISESLMQVEAPDKIYGLDPRVTTKLDDGTVVAKYPGTTYTFQPDGTQIHEFPNHGSDQWAIASVKTEPNGTTTYVHGDGSSMIKRPWTGQGVVEMYAPNGSRTN